MKIVKSNYTSFEDSEEGLFLRMDDLFVLSPSFEENPRFIDGLRIGSFEIVEIEKLGELKKVIGITDALIDEFVAGIEDEDEDEVPEEVIPEEIPEPELASPDEEEETVPDEEEPPVEPENETPEVPDEDAGEEEEEIEEPVIAFTEESKGWQEAVALVKDETDVGKLTFALRKDERKSVKNAIKARLSELAEKKE